MRSLLLVLLLALALLTACGEELAEGRRHLQELCTDTALREPYLDFYWDDLRSHQPELWAEALAKCTETCPSAVNCAPVRSVASWYRSEDAAADPSIPEGNEE